MQQRSRAASPVSMPCRRISWPRGCTCRCAVERARPAAQVQKVLHLVIEADRLDAKHIELLWTLSEKASCGTRRHLLCPVSGHDLPQGRDRATPVKRC